MPGLGLGLLEGRQEAPRLPPAHALWGEVLGGPLRCPRRGHTRTLDAPLKTRSPLPAERPMRQRPASAASSIFETDDAARFSPSPPEARLRRPRPAPAGATRRPGSPPPPEVQLRRPRPPPTEARLRRPRPASVARGPPSQEP